MNEIPSLADLQKIYEQGGGKGSVADEGKPKSKKAKVKPPPPVEAETKVDDEYAYCDVHFWTRSTDSWNQVLSDCKNEASLRGSGVIVFAHNHHRNEACTHLCRQVKSDG